MSASRLIDAIPTTSAEERRRMRDNARRLAERGGPRAAEARAMLEALDAFDAQTRERRTQGPAGIDMVAMVAEAFERISETEERLVRVVLDNPDSTASELTTAMGWKDQAWKLHFGKMCEKREHLLWPAPFEPKRNAPFYCGILADFDEVTRGFTLKPEVAEAFARLGLRQRGTP